MPKLESPALRLAALLNLRGPLAQRRVTILKRRRNVGAWTWVVKSFSSLMALENGKENFSNTEASPCVLDVPRDMNSVEHGLVETVCA